jgi:single-strand DNA-binding protein
MKVIGIGTFGKDPVVNTTTGGTVICSFSLAVTRKFKDKSGEKVTDWISCTAFGKTAETIGKYFSKGSKIMIEGELQNNNYTNKDGQKIYQTVVVVSSFEFVGDKGGGSRQSEVNLSDENFPISDEPETSLPFDL